MSAALVLPFLWAFAETTPQPVLVAAPNLVPAPTPANPPEPEIAFYRKYTEALLRRYVRMSMEAGKAPSLLGKDLFRANVTNYNVEAFDDVVISDLSVLKSQMKEIVGNGQPGRLAQLESRSFDHERSVQRMKGMAAAFGGLLTFAHVALDFFIARR